MKNYKKHAFALSILIALLCAGCGDKVVSSTSEKIGQAEGTNSCSKGAGYCLACGIGFDGKYDCKPKFKHSCPGTQQAIFDTYKVKRIHESGDVTFTENKRLVKATSVCI